MYSSVTRNECIYHSICRERDSGEIRYGPASDIASFKGPMMFQVQNWLDSIAILMFLKNNEQTRYLNSTLIALRTQETKLLPYDDNNLIIKYDN